MLKESTYQTPCGTIHYWSSILSLDTTTLVFLPGLTADHRLFDKQVAYFDGKYNIIVSNPPYIKSEEVEKLMPEVREYEPRMALDGDADGLKFYRKIIDECKEYMEKDGYIIFEIGYDQSEQVKELLRQKGFTDIEVLKDLSGNDRVVTGKRRQIYV